MTNKKEHFLEKTTIYKITRYVPAALRMFSTLITLNKESFK